MADLPKRTLRWERFEVWVNEDDIGENAATASEGKR